ncbi:diguanylate cyclase (GGDEF) domain-containing protein/HDIG domain-containing protein [Alicyclobacillus macrosporangiidus]|uniref:Diguanylate cyclase (GGDEF) domain-containing protein/HDIG domain-containing protein n=1 Tax=Alicyclobacillus macrosporangiidus TaxID=392015 RepID=A0A1I7IIQ2_9BACL|nr:diguanylate cyclase (GGDEF) domain-containing protein/HDIG domain-containing protein [Alicyclobacillus macrosporangiidus]
MATGNRTLLSSMGILYAVVLWVAVATWDKVTQPEVTIPDWVVLYSLTGFLLLVERFYILVTNDERINLESVYLIGFCLVYPIGVTAWAGLLYALISSIRYKRHWHTQLVNGTVWTLCALVAQRTYVLLSGSSLFTPNQLLAIIGFSLTYFVVNVVLLSVYFGLRKGLAGIRLFFQSMGTRFFIVYAVTVMIGILLAVVLQHSGLAGALLFTGLILLVSYTYRDYFKMANHFKELAIKDELTGLHNHRYIQSCVDRLIEEKRPFAFLMMDIDHFKRYNEVWGHVRGDEALKKVADVLRERRLPGEEIARYSGEEFAIVLPDYDLPQAQLKAELLRRAVEETSFPGAERLPGKRVTVSIGVAHYPQQAKDKKELMVMVDDALYKGKFTGRNKVSLYTSVLDEMKNDLAVQEEDEEIIRTIKVFLAILNSKDRYTYAHTERDVIYATALARRIGLPEHQIRYLRFGAFLHDIGKVEIPIEVLTKRGPLTREEWQIMKSHVEIGVNIAKPIRSLAPCLPIIRHHHERFDGTGYPDGLKGYDIPLEARILTIADSFDAMTTSRPYQRKRSMEEAFVELRSCAGRQFDPELVEPFIEVVQEIGLLSEDAEETYA